MKLPNIPNPTHRTPTCSEEIIINKLYVINMFFFVKKLVK